MSGLDIQVAVVAYTCTDPMTRMPCQEKECKFIAPLAAMFVWRMWRASEEKWIYFPFCHDHVLTCLPVTILGQG